MAATTGGSGGGERAAGSTGMARRATGARLSTETKHSSKTSELYIYLAVTIGALVAGLVTKAGDGHDDRFNAHDTWLVVAIVTAGYLLSRGLAKSGSREPYFEGGTNETRGDRDH
jgi:hypothetical protein